MSHFSVFNIGSNHTAAEPNQTIGVLGKECYYGSSAHKILTDGVKTLGGGYAGYFPKRLEVTVDAILKGDLPNIISYRGGGITQNNCTQPLRSGDTVNLTGHSRGAVMCHLVANRLAESVNDLTINIIVRDPVNMT
ncbi:MAG: hypothetical protein NT069_10695, partial [Planctomycetota bacterium]|nr:hypothetical protein [Planctomycetota bacterium]